MPRSLRTPEELKDQLTVLGWENVLANKPGRKVDDRVLWAHAAIRSTSLYQMQIACQYLEPLSDPLAIALRCAIASQVGELDDLLELPVPRVRTRRDADAVAWMRLSRSLALSALDRHGEALVELGMGIAIAAEADLTDRAQMLRFHARLLENQAGIPGKPEAVAAELEEPAPPPRKAWHSSNYVANLLQRGEYHTASQLSMPGSDFHLLANALRGVQEVGYLDDPYQRAAQTWALAWHGHTVERISGLRGKLLPTYARLALCLDLSRTPLGAPIAARLLGSEMPRQTDLAVLWSAIGLMAMGRGGEILDPLFMPDALNEALGKLRRTDEMLDLLKRLMPEVVVAVGSGPRAHPEMALAAHTLLRRADRPSTELAMAAFQKQLVPTDPNRAPNAGTVLVILERLATAGADEQRTELEAAWNLTREQLMFDYGHHWGMLGRQNYHCEDGEERLKVKA